MEKNKTALQTLIEWGDKMLQEHPMKLLSFAEAIDKAEVKSFVGLQNV